MRSSRRHVCSAQLALDLSAPPRWGGRRPGAGRKPGPKPRVAHAARAPFRRLPAHVTLRLRPSLPSLRTVAVVRELERTFAAGCARPGFRLAHYSLQGNHAHLIVEVTDRDALGRGMNAIGARIARAVNRVAGRVLSRSRVVLDRASSAVWFDGWKRWAPGAHYEHGPPPARRRCPVARPRTWLLRIGWRRHGLLDPSDVPGDRSKSSQHSHDR
ncbi:MAG: hypothetical protein E6J72_03800 [Deltaproteobacteria bacterium]|nr:MAG: hypothetical protein E6J72_03800 [Deltaproteobacteria bacterium]